MRSFGVLVLTMRDLERIKQIVLRAIIGLRGLWCYRPVHGHALDQVLREWMTTKDWNILRVIFKDLLQQFKSGSFTLLDGIENDDITK